MLKLCVRVSGESVSACDMNPGCLCVCVRGESVSACDSEPGRLCVRVRARCVSVCVEPGLAVWCTRAVCVSVCHEPGLPVWCTRAVCVSTRKLCILMCQIVLKKWRKSSLHVRIWSLESKYSYFHPLHILNRNV